MSDEDKALDSLARCLNAKAAAIEALMASPDARQLYKLLQDEFEGCLDYLCNFESARDHCGKDVEITEVIQKMVQLARSNYERLTGESYEPEIRRNWKRRIQSN